MFRNICRRVVCGGVAGFLSIPASMAQGGESLFERAPWTVSGGGGFIKFEGDEEVKDGFVVDLRLGYDFDPHWAVEGNLRIAPNLSNREFDDDRFALDEDIGAFGVGGDLVYHFRDTEDLHIDPFLALGAGFMKYEEDLGAGKVDFIGTGGGGVFIHFNDRLSLRGDIRTGLVSGDTEAKLIGSIGVVYRIGASYPVRPLLSGGELDSDGDGLMDSLEAKIGTDPDNPDTDGDGLFDGQEYNIYKTNPLEPDSDLDGLKDGVEVLTHKTNPLDPDTDDGGVRDGHEVIEDGTDPLDPSDDLLLIMLYIEFDYDKAIIRPEDYKEIDRLYKVLQRDPASVARIEGHADKRPKSKRKYNLRLSKRRAEVVQDYLVAKGVDPSRLTFEGYGFDRPLVQNDTEANMQKNRRVEVYIRQSGDLDFSEEGLFPGTDDNDDSNDLSVDGMPLKGAPVK